MINQPLAKNFITIYVGEKGDKGDQGDPGKDGEFFDLNPITEKCFVYVNSDNINGTLAIQLQYNIQHIKGSTTENITSSSTNYHIRFRTNNNTSNYFYLSYNTTTPSYTNASFLTNYHTATSKPEWLIVELCKGSSHTVLRRKVIPVVFNTDLLFDINTELNQITSVVQGHTTSINNLNSSVITIKNDMSNITQTMDQISSTVSSHTTSINGLTGDVSLNKSNISNLTQRADSIESTVSEHSNQINWALGDPENLYKSTSFDGGALNFGDGWINKWQFMSTVLYSCENWTKYNTPFYEGQTKWKNLGNGTSYLYAPYLYLYANRTYTLNCFFDTPDSGVMRIDLCRYANITNARNLGTIAAITNIRGDNWLDNDRDVVQFTPSTTGYYRLRFGNTTSSYDSDEEYTVELKYVRLYNGAKSISDICKWNDLFAASFSRIQQTANEITLQVNEISLILDGISKNITLNGDTIINGYLVLNDSDTGFILNSSNGSVQISPENIGSYSNFTGKTENDILVFQSKSIVPAERLDGPWDLSGEFNYDLGQISSGTLVKLTNYVVDFMQGANVVTPTSVSTKYMIYEGNTLKRTINISSQTQTTIANYTTTSTSNLKIKVQVAAVFPANAISTDGGTLKKQPLIRTTVSYKVTKPSTVFGQLSPNGLGFNFSNLSHFYAGPDGTIIKYNNYGLKIDTTGIYKMTNGNTWINL